MELHLETLNTTPIDSATLVLLRDSPQGLQVLLLQRHTASRELGGAYVFAGGKLDPLDQHPDTLGRLNSPLTQLHQRLGEEALPLHTAGGLYVAAIREAWEESGILFASPDPQDLPSDLPSGVAGWTRLQTLGRPLDGRALQPWTRWVTPRQASIVQKRFDTRFFVARAPAGQEALHDNHETTASVWLTPAQALQQYWVREIEMAPPQIMSLVALHRHATVDSVLQEAASRRPPLIQPEPFDENGVRTICYPGDPRHSQTTRVIPGPTRLHFVAGRFEPVNGALEALLGSDGHCH